MEYRNLERAAYIKDEINNLKKAINELDKFDIKSKALSITEYDDGSGELSKLYFYTNGNYNTELYRELYDSILVIYKNHLDKKMQEVETL